LILKNWIELNKRFKAKIEKIRMSKTLKLNSPAPDFRLNDFSGKEVSLSDFWREKNVILVFNRGFT